MKKALRIGLVLLVLGMIAAAIGLYEFNKPSKGAGDRSADATVTASSFIKEFKANATAADKKYNNQNIQLSGTIGAIEKVQGDNISVQLQEGSDAIECSFNGKDESLKTGDSITLKGLYSGYDDMIGMEIKLNKCALVK